MKILWLCNVILPKIAVNISKPESYGGGWLVGLSNDLLKQDNIDLSVCFHVIGGSKIIEGSVDNLHYYGFPQNQNNLTKYNNELEKHFNNIIEKVNPDIIHIFGTEYPHTLAMVNVCEKLGLLDKTVINIQGLVSIFARHYYSNLPNNIVRSFTFRDFVKQNNIRQQRNDFVKRGQFEIEALQKVKHIIGRTDWDKACTSQINSSATYHFCNETLRDEFYKHTWNIDHCERYSIFISQAGYPIKGFHFLLESLPLILKIYPETKVYVAGSNLWAADIISKLKRTSYARYISRLVDKYQLKEYIIFTDGLDEKQMCERFCKSNVFVSPSSIENSPNSVGEAMLLGVPTVSSDVGGVKNMLTHNVDGFIYQHDAPYMLAYYVCDLFGNDNLASKFSQNGKNHAQKTHDKKINLEAMLNIYKILVNQ